MNFHLFLWLLAASGRHARILLPLGVVLALLLPSSGAFFKPAAPYILAVLIGAVNPKKMHIQIVVPIGGATAYHVTNGKK